MAKKHVKRCSTSLIIRKMQIKTTTGCHLGMAIIDQQTTNAGEGVEKRKLPYTAGRNVNWYKHYGEQYGGSIKNCHMI